MTRKSGILLHPSSLPGPYGIGSLGSSAFSFIDWLEEAGQQLWQILPLGPTGYGDSPYASFSSYAGNPLLIDLETLVSEQYLDPAALSDCPNFSDKNVDFGTLIPWKKAKLQQAAEIFHSAASPEKMAEYTHFVHINAHWLESYVLFMDIKEHYDAIAQEKGIHGAMWFNFWPKELALAEAGALLEWKADKKHKHSMELRKTIQYFFFKQWESVKNYANTKNISIIGDLPIFVAADSVDVWANKALFQLDKNGCPKAVAGVPPDYFSKTGQLWGNPLYDWNMHKNENFTWWIERIKANLHLVDFLRIDHFRGFEAYWSVPYGNKTAENGKWEKAPGHFLFKKLSEKLGSLPILAEDLGFITEEVRDLRDSFKLPGMKIIQFAFDSEESGEGLNSTNDFLPHMYAPRSVVYTGTHDNDTLAGWLSKAKEEELSFIRSYLGYHPDNYIKALIRLALSSVSRFAVIPMQDILELGSEARMNIPSTLGNNWKWRASPDAFSRTRAKELKNMSSMYGRNLLIQDSLT